MMFYLGDILPVQLPASDPVSSWIGLILQGGALGILAYVVIRLAPKMIEDQARDRERREVRDIEERGSRDDKFVLLIETMHLKFGERNSEISRAIHEGKMETVKAIQEQTAEFVRSNNLNMEIITHAVSTACQAGIENRGLNLPNPPRRP